MAFRNFTPDEWADEIAAGLDYRRRFGIEGVWGELEAMYYNVHRSMANDGPNLIASTIDSLLSSLTVPDPAIFVKPEHPDAVSRAPLVESVDNILLRELRIREEADTAALHAGLFGCGFCKIGFDSEYGYDPKFDVGGVLRLGFTLTQFGRQGDRRIESDSTVSPGMPWVKAVDPRDIIVPWGTHRLSSSPWVAHRFVRQIDDLKADPKYKNTQRLQPTLTMEDFVDSYKSTMRIWRPNSSTESRGMSGARRFRIRDRGSRDVEYVELFEIHDRRTGRIYVIAPGHPSFLREDVNALQIDNRLPFVSISFTPKTRSIWTTSDAYYLQALQMEISDLAVQRSKIRRLSVLKFLYDGEQIDQNELDKLISPEVGAAAQVTTGGDINKAITTLQTHPDQTLILEEEHLRRNSREQIGFSRNQLGEFTGGRRTATEAGIVDRSAQLRMSRRGLAVRRLYEDIISAVNGIIFTHWTRPRYIQVMGPTQADEWLKIRGPELRARYSYDVTFTDESEVRQRRLEALNLYTVLSQDPSVDPAALRRYISDQINDPAFTRIFNADVQDAMRAVRLRAGLVNPQGVNLQGAGGSSGGGQGGTGGSSVPQLPGSNGQSQGTSSQGSRVASGGTNS